MVRVAALAATTVVCVLVLSSAATSSAQAQTTGTHPPKPHWIKTYKQWLYHYAYRQWMPDKWQRIGACETGYGKRPGRWDWNSGTYQGFAGFYHGTWDQYRHRADSKAGPYPDDAYEATPRQQYEVALAVYRAHGYGAWGCRAA